MRSPASHAAIVEPSAEVMDQLSPLEPETMRRIAASGVVRAFPKNAVLINEGDVGDALYIIGSGKV